jgi:hypothetical protein
LIIFVGDSETGLEAGLLRELAKQLSTERVDRPALYLACLGAEVFLEAARDLSCGLVGEREGADVSGVDPLLLNQESDALDEAESLSRSGASEHQHRPNVGLDGRAL